MRDVCQRVVQCDESALNKCLERFVVVLASERVSMPIRGTTKIVQEGHDCGIVIVEQTRWRHAEKRCGRV